MLAEPPEPQEVGAAVAAPPVPRDEGRHITRDFSYVRREIWRVVALSGFLIISLILTAIFLR